MTTNQDVVQNDGLCSLREAISAANSNNAGPSGDCTPGSGTQGNPDGVFLHATSYQLSLGPGGEDQNAGGDLDVRSDMVISGVSAATTTIDGQGLGDRVLDVASGNNVTIENVTITHGHARDVSVGPGLPGENGGGVRTAGTLSLTDSVVTLNSAGAGLDGTGGFPPAPPGTGGAGGGIYNTGTLTLTRSTVSSNVAGKGGDGSDGSGSPAFPTGGASGGTGGGIGGTGTLIAAESTVSGNSAGAGGRGGGTNLSNMFPGAGSPGNPATGMGGGSGGDGGGIDQPNVTLARTTLAANSTGAGGSGGDGVGGPGGMGPPNSPGGGGGQGTGGPGGAGGSGGGVFASASINATNLTVDSNTTGGGGAGGKGTGGTGGGGNVTGANGGGGAGTGGPGGAGGSGGGMAVAASGQIQVRYGTVSSNRADGGGAGGAATAGNPGTGGPTSGSPGTANPGSAGAAGAGGGVAASSGAPASVTKTILATNQPSNCSGAFAAGNTNDISFPADQPACPGTHGDPKLGPLGNHGGPTPTRLIGVGSALDAVPFADPDCTGADPVQTDQRLLPRLAGASCDIGAVEVRYARATTGGSKSVTGHGATVLGTVNPSSSATTYRFVYGTTTAYGSATPVQNAGSGSANVPVQAKLSKLKDGRTYHYRLVAITADGKWPGADRTFKTPDVTAPVIRSVSLSHKSFTPAKGTKLTYRLSEAAHVKFTITRKTGGKKIGSFTQHGHAGKNSKRFSGRVGKKTLDPGRYRVTLVATDAAHNRSRSHRVSFTILSG